MVNVDSLSQSVKSVLSTNTKLEKAPDGAPVLVRGISLAPSKRSGIVNVCAHASAGCIAACVLWFAGRTVTSTVRAAAINRTKLCYFAPAVFYSRLAKELKALLRKARKYGAQAYCRLNVASDIAHPLEVFTHNSDIVFFDYTKDYNRAYLYGLCALPSNYHLSFSVSENTTYAQAKELNAMGVNLVVVFSSYYHGPTKRYGRLPSMVRFVDKASGESFVVDTVDGDIHDIRTPNYDGRGVVVALRAKGGKATKEGAISRGFTKRYVPGEKEKLEGYHREGLAIVEL
jgi:hypothetical protein